MGASVEHRITAHRQLEGGGFSVRRPLPTPGLDVLDPLLLIDEMGPVAYAPGEAVGAPDHPHRGFETITYLLDGEFEHRDSSGHRGVLLPGDVQWMTAGAGVIHSEMPSERIVRDGGRVHGFQIWVNLPRAAKWTTPRYRHLRAAELPRRAAGPGARGVDVAGAPGAPDRDGGVPITFQHWTLDPGAETRVPLDPSHACIAYVFRGSVEIDGTTTPDGTMAILSRGDEIRFRSPEDASEVLLLGGRPLNEPVARYGPFVMNTREELIEAFRDFEQGRLVRDRPETH